MCVCACVRACVRVCVSFWGDYWGLLPGKHVVYPGTRRSRTSCDRLIVPAQCVRACVRACGRACACVCHIGLTLGHVAPDRPVAEIFDLVQYVVLVKTPFSRSRNWTPVGEFDYSINLLTAYPTCCQCRHICWHLYLYWFICWSSLASFLDL